MKVVFLQSSQASINELSKGRATWKMIEPFRMENAEIACHEFSFTNFFINISAAIGNNTIYYSDDALDETKYAIVIPDGSYTVSSLNSVMVSFQQAEVGKTIFELLPNLSTSKCYIAFNTEIGWFVHFSANNLITGFDIGNYPASKANTAYEFVYAQNNAAFNNIQSINVACNLTNDSISNSGRSSIIHVATPTVQSGFTENSKHFNLLWLSAPMLANSTNDIIISLTDQSGNPLVLTENFAITLLIR